MTTLNFSDRFSYPSPNGVSPEIDAQAAQLLSDEELELYSPDLKEMASMVRQYSVLLSRRRTLEIFNLITTQTDGRIALILASARSRENNFYLFGGLGAVKELMFADPARPGATSFTNRTLFSDGIRRVSVALTASILIGQLAQIPEQFEHSKLIEEQALKDLDRVVSTYELSQNTQDPKGEVASEQAPIAFYFEPKKFTIKPDQEIALEWYTPTLTETWQLIRRYRGNVDTWNIVSDLADSINSYGLSNTDSNLLAVAELSGPRLTSLTIPNPTSFHVIRFFPRRPMQGSIAHSINVRIERRLIDTPIRIAAAENEQTGDIDINPADYKFGSTPFLWGPNGGSLNTYPVNGSILVTSFNKMGNLNQEEEGFKPVVAYFRNKYIYRGGSDLHSPPHNSRLRFRVQPWHPNLLSETDLNKPQDIEVSIPRLIDSDPAKQLELDNYRFSQVAVALLNGLAQINLDTRTTGAIIRNDPYTSNDACSCVELVCWTVNKYISYIVLDILEMPEDIEMAVGDRDIPQNYYSSNPKSIKVECVTSSVADGIGSSLLRKDKAYLVSRNNPRLWQAILDESIGVEGPVTWL